MIRGILVATLFATPALADPDVYAHMDGWSYGHGVGMMFGPVLWLIVLGLVVAGVIWFARQNDGTTPRGGKGSARNELDMRFAKGEIDADDYAARKKLLEY
ncbi:SHOCT domain-containing protein [Histidinibacterium aquaticum]|uniref:SHOCT domain-containing protein n=1 Tax=Histidinibacterium aquaticum TaxID=2613962 RepID=UPI001CC74BFB|nr:hypothetical protein [Histidinibacterium aquaticum]